MRFRELGNELLDRGVEVSYIIDDRPMNTPEGVRVSDKAEVYRIPAGGFLQQTFARRKLIKEKRFDFVHVLNTSPKTCLATSFRGSCKLVGDWEEWPSKRKGDPIHRAISERVLDIWQRRCADVRVVCSTYMQEEFAKLGTPATYIPYAAYLEPKSEAPNPFPEPTLVYLGNMVRIWDHGILFRAFKILKARGKEFPCCFMGGGEELPLWREFVVKEGLTKLKILGYTPEATMWANLRHAHALLFPIRPNIVNLSRCPAKTFAYAQAMRPVLTCRVGEVPAVLGDKATYVSEPTPEAFADAIEKVMSQPRQNDIDYHVENQSWSKRAEALLAAVGAAR